MKKTYPIELDEQEAFEKNLIEALESMDATSGNLFWLRLVQSVLPRDANADDMKRIIKDVVKWALIPRIKQPVNDDALEQHSEEVVPLLVDSPRNQNIIPMRLQNKLRLNKNTDSLSDFL